MPADIPATAIADADRDRWRIEGLFAELERNLDGEIDTLGYPKAAMRAHHGVETIEEGLSPYYVADELSGTHRGMMIAVPDEEWHFFRSFTPAQLAALLAQLAANVDMRRFGKNRCGPRGLRLARLRCRNKQHVSTSRLLVAQAAPRRAP